MKFEFGLDDEKVLRLSGIGAGLYAAHAFVAPRHFHETWAAKVNAREHTEARRGGTAAVPREADGARACLQQ